MVSICQVKVQFEKKARHEWAGLIEDCADTEASLA